MKINKTNNKFSKNFIIIHPSGRYYGSGHYIQEWAKQLVNNRHNVIILSEGKCPNIDEGIQWYQIYFNKFRLSKTILEKIRLFNPDVIIEIGVRTIPMRVSLELKFLYPNAKFIVQAEDDENLVFKKYYPSKYNNIKLLEILDTKEITFKQLFIFFRLLDLKLSFKILLNPNFYRYVEPIMRILCYKIADMHTTIWYPMKKRLFNKFHIKTFVIPPFINVNEFYCKLKFSSIHKKILKKYSIKENSFILFVNGTIYDFSDEILIFIHAVKLLSEYKNIHTTIIILNINENIKNKILDIINLDKNIDLKIIGNQKEFYYNHLIKSSHIICAPGIEDEFNTYRMPSRLVKALAYGKPIFTFYTGFGESISKESFAFLTKTNSQIEWYEVLLKAYNKFFIHPFDYNSRYYAEKHFDSKKIIKKFNKIIKFL